MIGATRRRSAGGNGAGWMAASGADMLRAGQLSSVLVFAATFGLAPRALAQSDPVDANAAQGRPAPPPRDAGHNEPARPVGVLVYSVPPERPETLEYVPGQRVPDGYRLVERDRPIMVLVGALVGLPVYVFSAVVPVGSSLAGQPMHATEWWLLLPVAGPAVYGFARGADSSGLLPVMVVDTLAQAAGATLLIMGFRKTRRLVRKDVAAVMVTPVPMGSGAGLAALGRF